MFFFAAEIALVTGNHDMFCVGTAPNKTSLKASWSFLTTFATRSDSMGTHILTKCNKYEWM